MSNLESIAVYTENLTGNVRPLLHEIRHALGRLADGLGGAVIDLRSLPMARAEEQILENELGQGEICATLNALGDTTIRETSFPGVWLITHKNEADEVTSKFIEVTMCPELLKTQLADLNNGLARLDEYLSEGIQENAQ